MKKYENMETGEVMTLEEVREHFYKFAKENPKVYDCMSFNEFLNNALGKNGSLRAVSKRCIAVGHDYTYRGELSYSFHESISDAVDIICEDSTVDYVETKDGIHRYASCDGSQIYGIREIGEEPYIVVRWSDTSTTKFEIFTFDVESDAYIFMISDASRFLDEDYDAPRSVWFGENWNQEFAEIKIDVGDDIHRWNLIPNV